MSVPTRRASLHRGRRARLCSGALLCLALGVAKPLVVCAEPGTAQVVHFAGEKGELGGELYRPDGQGPFPAVLYNHGSAPGMLSREAAQAIGPLFARSGWVFFMPYRHGQGLSSHAGPYIGDELADARRRGGMDAASETLARLLATTHLNDQLSALAWLRAQPDVDAHRVALAGNSFGGVEALLGATHSPVCAVLAGSAGSESWGQSPHLQALMKRSAEAIQAPVMMFQAANDHDLVPQAELTRLRQARGLTVHAVVYPAFGSSSMQGHRFAYEGATTWFPDALNFLQQHCTTKPVMTPTPP